MEPLERVKVGKWQSTTLCQNCQRIKPYTEQHPADPCPKCGSKVIECVGRRNTILYKHWYNPFTWLRHNTTYWSIKET